MKPVTFAVAFILTVVFVIGGSTCIPTYWAGLQRPTMKVVFGFFLGPFVVVLFFCWLGEKLLLKIFKRQ